MRQCPACGNSYSDEANFCPMDATRLPQAADHAPPPAAVVGHAARGGVSTGQLDGPTEVAMGMVVGGRYQLDLEFIDTPTGRLYQATEVTTLGKLMAKLVPARSFASPMMLDRALRELRQITRVDSPHVLRIRAQGKTPTGDLFVVFAPPPEGAELLSDYVAAHGPFAPNRARRIVVQIGEALMSAQAVGVVHRNIAPHTVYLSPGGDGQDTVLVLDFALTEFHSINGRIVQGALHYLSPEQAEGKSIDQRSNLYSLAAIYYYLLTGVPPQQGKSAAEILYHVGMVPPAPPSQQRPGLPAALDQLVQKALEKTPGKRHLTLLQFLNELEALGNIPPPEQADDGLPYRSQVKTRIFGDEVLAPAPGVESAEHAPPPAETAAPQRETGPEEEFPRAERAQTLLGMPSVTPAALAAAFAAPQPEPAPQDQAPAPAVDPATTAPLPALAAEAPAETAAAAPAAEDLEGATIPMPRMSEAEILATFGLDLARKERDADPGDAGRADPEGLRTTAPMRAFPSTEAAATAAGGEEPKARPGVKLFRETAWFKRGEIGAMEEGEGKTATSEIPVTIEDRARLSLREGSTGQQQTAAGKGGAKEKVLPGQPMTEAELIDEMKGNNRLVIVFIVLMVLGGLGALGWTLFHP